MDRPPGAFKFAAKRLSIAGTLLLLTIVAVVAWQTNGPSEPVYDGKPLSRWIVATRDSRHGSPEWQRADEILRRTGTNALPTMLKMIRAKNPPPVVLKLMEMLRSRRLLFKNYRYASVRNEAARYAFEILGPTAAPAVPALAKIYEKNISPYSKRCAASALGSIGKSAQLALPLLLNDFTNSDWQVRFAAVSAVLNIGGDAKTLIPALQSLLRDPKHEIRANAAVALDANFHNRARPAVPALLEARDDLARSGDNVHKGIIEHSLWHIAPESVGKPLIVAEAIAVVTNSATAESLDIESNGQRRTLVPAGKRIPCEGQFWTQQPRGLLRLYKGSAASINAEDCLGEYEIIGIKPPPADVNVSLMLVVTEKNIFLCSRDNESGDFLKIRRIK
jgi:hypothetical protein